MIIAGTAKHISTSRGDGHGDPRTAQANRRTRKGLLKENFVNTDNRPQQRVSDQLHPLIHLAVAGLFIWFLGAGLLFVGGFAVVCICLPTCRASSFVAPSI